MDLLTQRLASAIRKSAFNDIRVKALSDQNSVRSSAQGWMTAVFQTLSRRGSPSGIANITYTVPAVGSYYGNMAHRAHIPCDGYTFDVSVSQFNGSRIIVWLSERAEENSNLVIMNANISRIIMKDSVSKVSVHTYKSLTYDQLYVEGKETSGLIATPGWREVGNPSKTYESYDEVADLIETILADRVDEIVGLK